MQIAHAQVKLAMRGAHRNANFAQFLLSQLVPLQACRDACLANYQKAPATIHILLVTASKAKTKTLQE